MIKYLFGLLFLILKISNTNAQNYFYNTNQFGLNSTLLGGAVTAGNSDLSMAYYNPAALHMAEQSANISLVQPQIETFGFKDFFGKETSPSRISFSFSPSIASYRLKVSEQINLVFITILKSYWNHNVESHNTFRENDLRKENIFKYSYQGRDRWLGLGGSYRLNDKFSIGISQFVSNALFNYDYTLSSSSHHPTTTQLIEHFSDNLISSISNKSSFVTKLGLQMHLGKHNIGLVAKTPNYLSISRKGTYQKNNLEITPTASSYREVIDFSLKPKIKTPWEFNFGYSFTFGSGSKWWINGAYYTEISDYSMATIETATGQTIDWTNGNRQVSNLSLGYSDVINPHLSLIGSVRTNFFAYNNKATDDSEDRLIILDNDRYHVVLGTKFKVNNSSILLGLDWGFTPIDDAEMFYGFTNIDRISTNNEFSFSNNSFTVLLTYGFLVERIKGAKFYQGD